jgi:hypothetical protein
MRPLRLVASALLVVNLNACFLGYDSRWGQAKRAQQRNAAAAAPATLQASPAPEASATGDVARPAGTARDYRVRVYATPAYAALTLDWHRRVGEIVGDGNAILGPSIGAQLTVEEFHDWSVGAGEEQNLAAALHALHDEDDGKGADWVIGFVGSLPRATRSFHELGMADVPGKHLVLRATSVAEEKDAIDRAFDQLSEADRAKLGKTRARHRGTAILLHEIGHTLGAIHARDPQSLMHAEYDKRMDAFGEGSVALMRAALAHRDEADAKGGAEALLSALQSVPADAWAPGERDPFEARLRGMLAPPGAPTAPAPAPLAPAAAIPKDLAALPEDARARFTEASRTLGAGDAAAAFATARPLFDAYPDVLSVQDLRCKIAMARSSDWTATRTECAKLMELSTGKK